MIDRFDLAAKFPMHATILMADENYVQPDLDWLLGDFWAWFQRQRAKLGLSIGTRKNDCDNFGRAYAQACADCWAVTPGDEQMEGIAVGEFGYARSDGAYHMIVAADTDQGIVFIEPQTGKQIQPTKQEIASCHYVRF